MIKETKSFKTSDGMLHSDKVSALHREFGLEIRGIIQSVTKSPSMSALDFANIYKANFEQFTKIGYKYNQMLKRATSKNKVEVGIV
jgi:hypothetical protein